MPRLLSSVTAFALVLCLGEIAMAGISSKVTDRFERSGQVLQEMIDAPD